MKNQIRFLPWPNPVKRENSYQRLMYAGLEANGIKILSTPPAFAMIRLVRRVDWLHLNWPDRIYDSKIAQKREKKYEKFINVLSSLKCRGVKIIWTMHNEVPHDTADIAFHEMVSREIAKLSDIIHVHFPEACTLLTEKYDVRPEKIHLMPHGVYEDCYGEKLPKAEARKQLGLPEDGLIILNLGNLKWYKGIDKAIEAFNESHDSSLYLLIAGKPTDNKMKNFLRASCEKQPRIILKQGKIRDKHISLFLSAADVFIFPTSRFFTSGSVLLALTYNLPVIGIPKNHLKLFEGKSYFIPWAPDNQDTLISILNNLDDRLQKVNYRELNDLKRTLNWKDLTVALSRKLKEI